MDFGNQWASGIKHRQITAFGFIFHGFGDAMRWKNHNRPIRHFIQLFDKYRTAIGKVFHHELVVYHFMAHINRRFKALKADIDDFDGSIDPSTKTTGIGE